MNNNLIEWAKGYLKAGYSPDQLYTYLISQGYSVNETNEALYFATSKNINSMHTANVNSTLNHQNLLQKPTPKLASNQINSNFNSNLTNVNYAVQPIISPQKKPFFTKQIKIGLIVFVVLLLIVGAYFIYVKVYSNNSNNDDNIYYLDNENNQDNQDNQDLNTQDELNIFENESVSNTNLAIQCTDMSCFETNFQTCQKASFTEYIIDGLTYYYEIIGMSDDLCSVKQYFINNPEIELIGKEMVCNYNNTFEFSVSKQDNTHCSGELDSLINNGDELLIS